MDEFKKKVIFETLKVKYKELESIRLEKYNASNDILSGITICLHMYGIKFYSNVDCLNKKEDDIKYMSKKIEYAKTEIELIKNGLDDHETLVNNIYARKKFGLILTTDESLQIEKYMKALQKVAGGTYEGLLAIEMINGIEGTFEIDTSSMYGYKKEVLEEHLKKKLKAINFYKKTKKYTRKTKFLRIAKKIKKIILLELD